MATGAIDGNGVWIYGEDDERDTAAELLNIGQEATSDAIGADRARLAVLEAAGALGGVTSGVFSAASGWSVGTGRGRKKNGLAFVEIEFTRTGSAITVPSNGDITNELIATFVAGWVPASGMYFPMSPGHVGGVVSGRANNAGVMLSAVAPGVAIATGATFSLLGCYPLA